MATTVTASNCTVTITESYELNGVNYGNTKVKPSHLKEKFFKE